MSELTDPPFDTREPPVIPERAADAGDVEQSNGAHEGAKPSASTDDVERAREIAAQIDIEHDDAMQANCKVCQRVIPFIAAVLTAARAQGRAEMREMAEYAVGSCGSLDENGYICEKATAIAAIRALPLE